MDLVSIIIPVYNSREYLETAINSIQKQTYRNIEIILVDDGATDGSGLICDKISKGDERITVVHKLNGGICSARNTGLKVAKGKYIMFSDDDDYYEFNAVETAVSYINKNSVDMVKFRVNYITLLDDIETRRDIHGYEEKCRIEKVNALDISDYASLRESKSLVYIWNAIYTRDVINKGNIHFDERYKYGGEDFDFNYQYLANCQEVLFVDDVLYTHYKRSGHSTSAKFNSNQIDSVYLNLNRELELFWNERNKNANLFIITRHFWGLMSVMENLMCPYDILKIRAVYNNYHKKVVCKNILGYSYGIRMLRKSDLNIKRTIIMILLKYKFFTIISIISYTFRNLKKKRAYKNGISKVN